MNASVLSNKHMAQAVIDYHAIKIRIMSGVISHEEYNTFALNTDLMVLLQDRIHEYTVAVDVRLKADGVVPFPDRYADDRIRNFLENFGIEIGDILATKKYVPTEEELNVLFDNVLLKHNLPIC